MRFKKRIISILICLVIMLLPANVFAATASVTFGSSWYTIDEKGEFPIGLYLNSDAVITSYQIKVQYDNLRLKYISGADLVDDSSGVMTFEGNGNGTGQVRFWLTFEPVGNGEAAVKVLEANVIAEDSSVCELTELGNAPVYIAEDVADYVVVETEASTEVEVEKGPAAEVKPADEVKGTRRTPAEKKEEKTSPVKFDINKYLFFIVSVLAVIVILIVYLILVFSSHRISKDTKKTNKTDSSKVKVVKENSIKEKKKPEKKQKIEKDIVEDLNDADLNEADSTASDENKELVIGVHNVTMKFKVSTSSASGIKDFIIQKLKKQVTFRELKALDNVSFDVYKGEVVGIIGTNGSGKSTMLKIVSGALRPTSGHVDVDKTKIQLLTLGTGFDHELTARENVYLNGAIIGYSKEFLDSHFDEIVEFAELDGFMDEKVKNFSSGMVSRLGFAIATVGEAAEILILDEVLSVGDEFFRKKSLKRVKEMIHGGSTVIMVSHSMGTIKDNCSKVVWIEKGELRMVGTPDEVCPEYRKLEVNG